MHQHSGTFQAVALPVSGRRLIAPESVVAGMIKNLRQKPTFSSPRLRPSSPAESRLHEHIVSS